jgi:type VI protein secretion system component VasF
VRGGEAELTLLVETLRDELARLRIIQEDVLSPHGGRPAASKGGSRRNLPIVWLSAAAIGTAVLINLALHVSLSSGVGDVAARITTLTARATGK